MPSIGQASRRPPEVSYAPPEAAILGSLAVSRSAFGGGRSRVLGGAPGRARSGLRSDLLFEAQNQPGDRGVKAGEPSGSSARRWAYSKGFRSPNIVGISSVTVG